MKSIKQSAKGSSTSSAAASGGGNRKTRWEPEEKPPSDRRPASASNSNSNSKPSKSKDSAADPSTAYPAGGLPKEQQPPPPSSSLPGALAQPLAPGPPFPVPDIPPPPSYGFQNLERRTIVLADGSVRSYFALPPDDPAADKFFAYGGRPGFPHGPEPGFLSHGGRLSPRDFRAPPLPPYGRGGPEHEQDYLAKLDGPRIPVEGGPSWLKRKYVEEDELAWHRQRMLQYGNPNVGIASGSGGDHGDFYGRSGSPNRREYHDDLRFAKQTKLGGDGYDDLRFRRGRLEDAPPVVLDVDPQALKKAFLKLSKAINENLNQRRNYLEDGQHGPVKCVVCDRNSKDFTSVHELLMHAYNSQNSELRVDHLGLHKALCVLMGWNYSKVPENSKIYQLSSAEDARENREDLIIWPPIVIIQNAILGRRKDGQIDGISNREMDNRLKELGFSGGKAKAIYGKEGHTGITIVRFANTQAGLDEAERLAQYFRMDDRGRDHWFRLQASKFGNDDKNPSLVKADEKTEVKKRILYGYLGTASDLDRLDFDTRKKAIIKSKKELDLSD